MKNYMQISYRYIRLQKEKFIYTFISICIFSMLISVVLMTVNILRESEVNKTREIFGDYHVRIKRVNEELKDELLCYKGIEDVEIQIKDYDNRKNLYEIYFKIGGLEKRDVKALDFLKTMGKNLGINIVYKDKNGDEILQDNIEINYRLVKLFDGVGKTPKDKVIYVTGNYIIIILMIVNLILINNTFNMTVDERINQYGLLKGIGATPKQIERIVRKEGVIISLIAACVGNILIYVIYLFIKNKLDVSLSIFQHLRIIAFSVSCEVVCTLIAIKRLMKVVVDSSVIENVSTVSHGSKFNYNEKKNNFLMKYLGIEASIAYKNIYRDKNRHSTIIYFIIISIALFMNVYPLSKYDIKNELTENSWDYDYIIKSTRESISQEVVEDLRMLPEVKEVYGIVKQTANILINEEYMNKEREENIMSTRVEEGKKKYLIQGVDLEIFNKDNVDQYKELLIYGTCDYETILKENGIMIIENGYVKEKILTNLYIGDQIEISSVNRESFQKVKVMGKLNKMPQTIDNKREYNQPLVIICTEELFRKLDWYKNYKEVYIKAKSKRDYMIIEKKLKNLADSRSGLSYTNLKEKKEIWRYYILQKQAAMYGIIIFFSMTAFLNIFNNIISTIMLRKKELAYLMSAGMSNKQIINMVKFEGMVYGFVGGGLGVLSGGALYFIINCFNGLEKFDVKVLLVTTIISLLVLSFIIILSISIPVKIIKKYKVCELIRETI